MARAIWLALAFAALASGARYVDYSEAKMPEYGGAVDYEGPRDSPAAPSEDYRDRLPDVPAALDYEETAVSQKSVEKDVEDSEQWPKPAKKHRKSSRSETSNLDVLDNSSDEIIPNIRSNQRFPKYRPRPKYRAINKEDIVNKRPVRYGRYRKEVIGGSDNKDVEELDDFNEDKIKHRVITERVARRKPRDKLLKPDADDDDSAVDDELLRKRFDTDYFLSDDEVPLRPTEKRPSGRVNPVTRDEGDLEPSATEKEIKRVKPKKFDEYSDYYDMKRVQGIKDKLPVLLRRSSTTTLTPTPSTWSYDWTHRRKMIPLPIDEAPIAGTPQPESTEAEFTTTTKKSTTRTTTTTTTFSTTTKITEPEESTTTTIALSVEPKNLSLAEKSRLSIMKKSMRKEMLKLDITNKPPVLMQVTNRMQTVVMVEPPNSENPMLRAREVTDDNRAHLDKVRRLMRHKLVANAKNIHDLTDNWDDMVCDYIDVALLESSASIRFINSSTIFFIVLNIFYTVNHIIGD